MKSILASLKLLCRLAVRSAGTTVCPCTLSTVWSGSFVVNRQVSLGCTAWRCPGALPLASIFWPIVFRIPTTVPAPWRPCAGQRRTALRCPPCTSSILTRFFRRCPWVTRTLRPAEMSGAKAIPVKRNVRYTHKPDKANTYYSCLPKYMNCLQSLL